MSLCISHFQKKKINSINKMLVQVKDPAIKLFGKTIPFSVIDPNEFGNSSGSGGSCSSDGSEIGVKEVNKVSEVRTVKILNQQGGEESMDGSVLCEANEKEKALSVNEETENGNEEGSLKEKTHLKKPDKLIPCPRCNSMDTKFCYYNNYNVLQPRHFCKGCQRYWTAGGAMRNVPVGAGRRKSKNAVFQNRYLTSNGFAPCPPGLKSGSVLLTVGGDATVNGSVSNVTQMPFLDPARNLTHKFTEGLVTKSRIVGEVNSKSCIAVSNGTGSTQTGRTLLAPNLNDSLAQISCIPAWPNPWNAALPPPAFPHPGFALPFVPPTYWPCAAAIPNTWNAPWLQSPSPSPSMTNSKSPVLGKHSRDEAMPLTNKSDKLETPKQPTVLTPKTLRIVHPEEAAKSSIWETLGIKNETISKGGLFRDLKSKDSDKIKRVHENCAHLTSNPAALSRSLIFQEAS